MKIIDAGYKIITPINGKEILEHIEQVARTCYKSEGNVKDGSAETLVRNLIASGHEAMLEHYSFSVKFIVDRGVSHELVRHRVASFAQESTRYCNYSQEKFGNEITVIFPSCLEGRPDAYLEWRWACSCAEKAYFQMLKYGATPQEARAVLPNSLKTEVVMTANLREWRHFFDLRAVGTTGKPHPQMLEVTVPLLKELKQLIPVVFDDIIPPDEEK